MRRLAIPALLCLLPAAASAADPVPLDRGDTAWMLVATGLVLFMTIPGLALFYGGLVRTKNVLSVLVQCFALVSILSLVWLAFGYSAAFASGGGADSIIGGLQKAFLRGIGPGAQCGTIPESVFAAFQLTFFIITPALIVGGFAERMKFSAMLIFSVAWAVLAYLPICHMAWSSGGLFAQWGLLDFAGGTVVHINAGVAALVACILCGKRLGYPQEPMKPHNLTMTVCGAGMLWVGWFGFNGGSALAADGAAGMAMLVTHLSGAAGAASWSLIELIKYKRVSALGIVSGAVAGLAAVTPASGTCGPVGGLCIGLLSGAVCYWGAVWLKRKAGWDDSLDAFGVHGVGGFLGTVLAGVFASTVFGGSKKIDILHQVGVQSAASLITAVWSAAVSVGLLLAIRATIGLRVTSEQERLGLDLSLHEEQGYILY